VPTRLTHIRLLTLLISLMSMIPAYSQVSGNIIYIAMDGRKEIRLAPKVDTLVNGEEYTYKLTIDPQYKFTELFCEKGLAVKMDNFLRITPNSSKQSGYDTVVLRIIL
jgi:hypothetical protein